MEERIGGERREGGGAEKEERIEGDRREGGEAGGLVMEEQEKYEELRSRRGGEKKKL
jgi:hypothetical protein